MRRADNKGDRELSGTGVHDVKHTKKSNNKLKGNPSFNIYKTSFTLKYDRATFYLE